MKSICTGMLSACENAAMVFTARAQQQVTPLIVLAYLRRHLVYLACDLSLGDQLMVDLVLNISDLHGDHLGTRE